MLSPVGQRLEHVAGGYHAGELTILEHRQSSDLPLAQQARSLANIGRRRHSYQRVAHRLERLGLIEITGVLADIAIGDDSHGRAIIHDWHASKASCVHLRRDGFELLVRSRRNGILGHPGSDQVVLRGSAADSQDGADGFAQDEFGDATKEEALEASSPVRGHYDYVGVDFLLGVQDGACGLALMDQEFVLEPGQPLMRDLEQLGASSLFLPLVEIHVNRHAGRRDDHRHHVQDEHCAVVLAGEIGGGIERLHRVIVEIHRAKDFAELRCHKNVLLRGRASC